MKKELAVHTFSIEIHTNLNIASVIGVLYPLHGACSFYDIQKTFEINI